MLDEWEIAISKKREKLTAYVMFHPYLSPALTKNSMFRNQQFIGSPFSLSIKEEGINEC